MKLFRMKDAAKKACLVEILSYLGKILHIVLFVLFHQNHFKL